MALVTTKEMFEKSMKEHFAIGAFNINNMEFIQAITEAANEANSPVILQVSSSAIKYATIPYLKKMVEAAVETTNIPNYDTSTNWFDKFCSFLNNLFGG